MKLRYLIAIGFRRGEADLTKVDKCMLDGRPEAAEELKRCVARFATQNLPVHEAVVSEIYLDKSGDDMVTGKFVLIDINDGKEREQPYWENECVVLPKAVTHQSQLF